jgi:hypothetical protein
LLLLYIPDADGRILNTKCQFTVAFNNELEPNNKQTKPNEDEERSAREIEIEIGRIGIGR